MRRPCRQRGVALLALVAILMVAVTGAVISALSVNRLRLERESRSTAALAEVAEAVIGWSVSHPDHPGMLPYPDRGNDGNYDGNSDCISGAPSSAQLLGRVPWLGQTAPCVAPHTGLGVSVFDGHGETPWMAVSRNLMVVPPTTYPSINLTLRNNLTPPTPWMTVVDATGEVLSDRVAVVLLAPGAPLAGQVRAGAAAPDNFLDDFQAGAKLVDNADNSDLTFVVADPTDTYNDRLRFITVDEWFDALMPRLEGEMREVRASLERYRVAHGYYPPFAALTADGVCVKDTSSGYLPLTDGDCGPSSSLNGYMSSPSVQLPKWLNGWGLTYTRDSPTRATITLNGVSYVITP